MSIGDAQDAEYVADTKVFVEHTVTYILANADRYVVPRRHGKGQALVDAVTVNFLANGQTRVWAGGTVCNKDGTFGKRRGRSNETVDLPDADEWIRRARTHIDGGGALRASAPEVPEDGAL